MSKHAVYPGSFDPFTNGHYDIVKRSCTLFDKLTIAILENSSKQSLFTPNERLKMIQAIFKKSQLNIVVTTFKGLLVDFCKNNNIHIIVRGLRTITDFDYEHAISLANKNLLPQVETIFLTAQSDHAFISSSIVKEIASLKGDIKNQVPIEIYNKLKQTYE